MTNGEKFFEVFGDAPNFRLETVVKESEKQYNFVAFLQEWWDDEYKNKFERVNNIVSYLQNQKIFLFDKEGNVIE